MLAETTRLVEQNTPPELAQRFETQLKENISRYAGADRQAIEQRLREIDSEWDIERAIEFEAPVTIGLGIALGMLSKRRWFAVSAMAASMVIVHNLQGWYPLLPIFRRLGLRTQQEIGFERMALKVLRGDHNAYQANAIH